MIRKHVQSGGPYHNNQCTQCTESFKSYSEHELHVKYIHMGNWKYKCGLCEDLLDTKDEIRSHRMKKHATKTRLIKRPRFV